MPVLFLPSLSLNPRGPGGLAAATAVLVLVVLAGCVGGAEGVKTTGQNPAAPASPAGPAGRYKVTAATTSFYRLGPEQPGGPDLGLKKGTRLTLVRRGFGYSQVQLEDGTAGFVGTEDVARLTPEEIAAEAAAPTTTASTANARPGAANPKTAAAKRRPRPVPTIPIVPGEEPNLPAAPDPTPRTGPVPTFRY